MLNFFSKNRFSLVEVIVSASPTLIFRALQATGTFDMYTHIDASDLAKLGLDILFIVLIYSAIKGSEKIADAFLPVEEEGGLGTPPASP